LPTNRARLLPDTFAAPEALAVLGACVACAVAAHAFGPDANWDLRNYHLYVAWAWLHDRATSDVAAAQAQTWFNPLLWVPHFLAFQHLGGAALATVVGALQGMCTAPLLAIAARLAPDASFAARAFAVAGGMTAATVIGQLGASYGDVILALALLVAVAILLRESEAQTVRVGRLLVAGALLGAVPALKLSHAPASLGLCIALPLLARGTARWRLVGLVGAGALATFVLVAGPWSWALWREWGNPVFPQFDHVFGGGWIAPGAARDLRFVPASGGEVLARPLAPLYDWRATSDYRIRDARLPLLFLALGALAIRWRVIAPAQRRMLAFLGAGFLVAYVLWLPLFGYHRYIVAFELLAPLLLLATASAGLGRRIALAAIALAIMSTNAPNHERAARDWPAGRPLATAAPIAPDTLVVLAGVAPTAHALPFLPPFAAAVRVSSNLHGGVAQPAAGLDALAASRIAAHDGPLLLLADPRESAQVDLALAGIGLARMDGGGAAIDGALVPSREPALRLWPLRRLASGAPLPRQ
jgi:hypothetical protein